jgi:hypothetical protein
VNDPTLFRPSLNRLAAVAFSVALCAAALPALPALAQDEEATTETATETTESTTTTSTAPAGGDLPEISAPTPENLGRATALVEEALGVATRHPEARVALARGAAALLPRLEASSREALTQRWIRLIESPNSDVPRNVRLDAYSSFFDVASRTDLDFARKIALTVPDDAARAGAFLDISEAVENANYNRAIDDARLAQQAARGEEALGHRARVLTYVALRLNVLDAEGAEAAITEASSNARLIQTEATRDYLLAELAGGVAKKDLTLSQRIANSIGGEKMKALATARIQLAQASPATLTVSDADRIAALVKNHTRYDTNALPILLQLPATPEVLKAVSDALPPIYVTARPMIDESLLERLWRFSLKGEANAQRDELQSRLARLMVLQDLWRGRDWGKHLAWKGGRVQVGAFLKSVLEYRQSQSKAMPLHDIAKRNVDAALVQARSLPPTGEVEALLLIAGQLLG